MERESTEKQDEFGWEDVSRFDDGAPDMGEPAHEEPEPEPAPKPAPQPDATPATASQEEPAAEAAAAPEGEPPQAEEVVYTLPGGQKVKQSELAANPELLQKLVTHSNQLTNYQRLAEERQARIEQVQAENRQILDQFTAWQMQQQQAQHPQQQQAPARPDPTVVQGSFAPYVAQLRAQGRITDDQAEDFGNLISEYLYDQQAVGNTINTVASLFNQRLMDLEQRVTGQIVPDLEMRAQSEHQAHAAWVQQEVAQRPGYEALAQNENWEELKRFIAQKVAASPRDAQGNPTFDPVFDPETMAQMYDAMTGAQLRVQMAAEAAKKTQQEAARQQAVNAGGESTARAATPPRRAPGEPTPEEEAMDIADPRLAIG